ncbi:hypothetical protein [Nonomuraea dietziae]|uniref:hypothetical protein n=1 Tax=Nonomuraea dietziae TaxID=65515 RepID=UPI0031D9E6D8
MNAAAVTVINGPGGIGKIRARRTRRPTLSPGASPTASSTSTARLTAGLDALTPIEALRHLLRSLGRTAPRPRTTRGGAAARYRRQKEKPTSPSSRSLPHVPT